MREIAPIGPLIPFVCSYSGPGGREFGITLWGTSAALVQINCRALLPDLRIDGVLIATCPALEDCGSPGPDGQG